MELEEKEVMVINENHPHFREIGYAVSEEYLPVIGMKMIKVRGDYNYFFAKRCELEFL